jgi:hypothetical protein
VFTPMPIATVMTTAIVKVQSFRSMRAA